MIFRISLLDNAVDELNSVRCDLELYIDIANSKIVPISEQYFAVKRIIKQIVCSWELLLKYRLQCEDWRKIFSKPEKASIETLKSGDFVSVGWNKACKELEKYSIIFPYDNLKKLHEYRNLIEHYQIDKPLVEVLETVARSIDELSNFYEKYIENLPHDTESISRGISMFWELDRLKKMLSDLLNDTEFIVNDRLSHKEGN